MLFKVATNVVARQPPKRWLTGIRYARSKQNKNPDNNDQTPPQKPKLSSKTSRIQEDKLGLYWAKLGAN